MKRLLLIIIFAGLITPMQALSLFGGLKTSFRNETAKLNDSVNKKFSDVNADLATIKGNQVSLNNEMKAHIDSRVNIMVSGLKSEIKAVGYDRSSNQELSSGRDTSIINDTELLKKVSLYGLYIILGLVAYAFLTTIFLFAVGMKLIDTELYRKNLKRDLIKIKNGGAK